MKKNLLTVIIFVFFSSCLPTKTDKNPLLGYDIFKRVDPTSFRIAQRDAAWSVVGSTGPSIEFVCLDDAVVNELITNAIDWINQYVRQQTKHEIAVRSGKSQRAALYIGFGNEAAKKFDINVDPGPQGFVLKQIDIDGKKAMYCWSSTALGCRYGLIEFLRSLKTKDGMVVSDIEHVVDAPEFPVRIHYINFAEHLQNAYNPNVYLDTEFSQWSLGDWERYIDMISAYRYNIFEFWLLPALVNRQNKQKCEQFINTINHVIGYAKKRGISVHPLITVNTIGSDAELHKDEQHGFYSTWFYACPNDPVEKKRIIDAWDFWTKSIKGNDSWLIFPGDPGGCTRNGCTKETFIDLSLELSALIRKNNPKALVEIGTWGEPFSGWGTQLWAPDSTLTKRSMEYLLQKLPKFPQGTFVSINREFNPDADADRTDGAEGWSGGDGRPYAKRVAELVPVLTWDFSGSEGENSVAPRCRVRRMIETRKKELEVGCYSGGICFTMAPKLQCLSAFCSAEVWWNPHLEAEKILDNYGRFTFGDGNEKIGHLLEEFEVIPDWGYYAPFSYSPVRLRDNMNSLLRQYGQLDVKQSPRLPLSVDYAKYLKSMKYFTTLFRDLAEMSLELNVLDTAFRKTPFAGKSEGMISLTAVMDILAENKEFKGRDALEASAKKLLEMDVRGMKQRYWDSTYEILNHIPPQAEDRKPNTMNNVFEKRFQASLAEFP
jgi:hypothetical protein